LRGGECSEPSSWDAMGEEVNMQMGMIIHHYHYEEIVAHCVEKLGNERETEVKYIGWTQILRSLVAPLLMGPPDMRRPCLDSAM
jgi:hypothetical protein